MLSNVLLFIAMVIIVYLIWGIRAARDSISWSATRMAQLKSQLEGTSNTLHKSLLRSSELKKEICELKAKLHDAETSDIILESTIIATDFDVNRLTDAELFSRDLQLAKTMLSSWATSHSTITTMEHPRRVLVKLTIPGHLRSNSTLDLKTGKTDIETTE